MSPFCFVTNPPLSMDRVTLHKIWAPDASVWSPWVKPVPFAFWPRALKSDPPTLHTDISPAYFPDTTTHCALVIDFPGGESVRCGELLATLGYRPVPIFSGCTLRADQQDLHRCAVDVEAIITALVEVAPTLTQMNLPEIAPPAFLLDACRHAPGVVIQNDYFDNRSAIFSADFPSAETLRKHGITRILVVRDSTIPPSPDLGHALNQWRQAGLPITAINHQGISTSINWAGIGFFWTLFHRLNLMQNFHPSEYGGYGRYIPKSSGG